MSRRGAELATTFAEEVYKLERQLAKKDRQLPPFLQVPMSDGPPPIEHPETRRKPHFEVPDLPEFDIREKARMERELLGVYVADHPFDHVRGKSATPLRKIQEDEDYRPERLDIFGVVLEAKTSKSKRGNLWTSFMVEDASGGGIHARAFGGAAGLPMVGHVARIRGRSDPKEDGTVEMVVLRAEDYQLKEEW